MSPSGKNAPFRRRVAFCVGACFLWCGQTANATSASDALAQTEVRLTPEQVAQYNVRSEPYGYSAVSAPIVTMGTLAYDDQRVVQVYSPVSGVLTRALVALGAPVHSGQPLALLSSPDMAAAKADVQRAQASLQAATHNSERQRKLFAQKAASERDVEAARDDLRHAEAEAQRASQRFALLSGGQAEAGDPNFWLRSPIDGEVVARTIDLGSQVQGQYGGGSPQALFTIANLDSLWLLADLHESEVGRVKVGARVRVRAVESQAPAPSGPGGVRAAASPAANADAAQPPVFGTVHWLADVIDPQAHTLQVRGSIDNRERRLRPNMKVTLQIESSAVTELSVPKSSVVFVEQQAYVFVQPNAAGAPSTLYRLRPVELSEEAPDSDNDNDPSEPDETPNKASAQTSPSRAVAGAARLTIKQGLAAGEIVVTQGAAMLLQALAKKSAH